MVKGHPPKIFQLVAAENMKLSEGNEDHLVRCIVLKMENFGCSLTAYQNRLSQTQVLSILAQVTCSLAVAEKALKFEQRDLHEGNILLKPTKDINQEYRLDGQVVGSLHVDSRKQGASICDIVEKEGNGDYSRFYPISNKFWVFVLDKSLIECLKRSSPNFRNKLFVICEKAQHETLLFEYYNKVLVPSLRQQMRYERWPLLRLLTET
ncbi:GSG2 [Cordylochernes scorpioides]|uniref:GSG2 n=1 Tax=Cordylochernes scorpioides TaxID=51811 RepID=A0ABY6LPG9_9ARAC|nr:GSG2 [Cordylochernes scorpioides]